jgi:aldehyde dehydrogenase (NAD+)
MREPVTRGDTRALAWRRAQLQRLEALLDEAETVLPQALAGDLGKPELEAWVEGVSVRHELRHTRRHLHSTTASTPTFPAGIFRS